MAQQAPGPLDVLVVGAGELGIAMLRALSASQVPYRVSVLLRPSTFTSTDTSKQSLLTTIHSLGVTPFPGDYAADSLSTLTATFARFHTVIVCSGYSNVMSNLQVKLAQAALAAAPNLQRFFPWQFGVDYDVLGKGTSQDLFDEQLEVRKLLRAQTQVKWVIVSVGVFLSFLFEPWWGAVDLEDEKDGIKGVVRALGSWDTKFTVKSAEDIGTCTVDILEHGDEEGVGNGVVFVAGETLTYADFADNVEKGVGKKLRRELRDMDYLMEELRQDPQNGLKKYRPIFGGEKGIAWNYETSWNAKRGIKTTGTEAYARGLAK